MEKMLHRRKEYLDVIKGFIILLMCLDHVRLFLHSGSYLYNPTDPLQSSLPVFFTRWITHFCEPIFCFTAGLSAWLVGRKKTKGALSIYLLKRGLWLILAEITLVNFAWHFDVHFHTIFLSVFWMLGVGMIALSALIHLGRAELLLGCSLVILGHNMLDGLNSGSLLWSFLHAPDIHRYILWGRHLMIADPLLPWVAVMGLGYGLGFTLHTDLSDIHRRRLFFKMSGICLTAFVLMRMGRLYGDPKPFMVYTGITRTLMSFFNVAKYPPSLQYLLLTLGVFFAALPIAERTKNVFSRFLSLYGRVPFFFYVVHIYVIHLLALLVAKANGWGWQAQIINIWPSFERKLGGFGFNLGVVYLFWIAIISALYPLCRWFDRYKRNNPQKWWLHYL